MGNCSRLHWAFGSSDKPKRLGFSRRAAAHIPHKIEKGVVWSASRRRSTKDSKFVGCASTGGSLVGTSEIQGAEGGLRATCRLDLAL